MSPIRFPGPGGFEFNINRIAFNFLGLTIHWYGIIIAFGFLLAIIFCMNEVKKEQIDSDIFLDLVLICTPISIVSARVYYVIFNWEYYRHSLFKIIAIWEGGIAIYGAIISAFITSYIYCRIKKINILKIFDITALGFMIGQIIGRWGNFINQEAYGRETNLPWRMEIYDDLIAHKTIAVHPTFLYESIWSFLGFVIIYTYRFLRRKKNNKMKDGETFLLYIAWYGLGRFWVESLRIDSLYLGKFRISQIISLILVSGSILSYFAIKNQITTKK